MVDFGQFQIPFDSFNVMLITIGACLAILYVGIEIIIAISGLVAVILALRSFYDAQPLHFAGFELGRYPLATMLIVGLYLIYYGLSRYVDPTETKY